MAKRGRGPWDYRIREIKDGDSSVVITDLGTGEMLFKPDDTEIMSITVSGIQLSNANARVTAILDEDAMGSNSATALVTQQSLVAYVATQLGALSADKITEGNTTVETVDAGTGQIDFTVDGVLNLQMKAGSFDFKGSASVALMKIGQDDAVRGSIVLYGDDDAAGGNIKLYVGAGEDGNGINYFEIGLNDDSLNIGPAGNLDALAYDRATARWVFDAPLKIGDGDYIEWDPAPGSDLGYSGDITTLTVDSNATGIGAALYMAGDGNLDEADADAAATMPVRCLAVETSTGSKKVLLRGFIRDDSWTWTPGGTIFASTTLGGMTQTAPSGSGDQVQVLGFATHADRMFFNPSGDIIEVA